MSYEMDRLRYGKQEKEKGIAEGLEQGQSTFVRSLSEKGMTISEIATLGDMTVEAVERILNS